MNPTAAYKLTVIVPVYNEKECLPALEESLAAFLPQCRVSSCVLFVDDGSKDGSGMLLEQMCSRHQDFHFLRFASNRGLSAALKAGFDHCESELVGYIDADLQTAPEDFNVLLDALGDHTMAMGIREKRRDSAFKRFQSRFANGWRRMFTHDGAQDTGCPLKVIRTEAARRIPMFKGMHRFLPALLLLQEGASYVQVPVRHFPRKAGKSKFHIWNRLAGPFADCFAYLWMKPRFVNYTVSKSDLD